MVPLRCLSRDPQSPSLTVAKATTAVLKAQMKGQVLNRNEQVKLVHPCGMFTRIMKQVKVTSSSRKALKCTRKSNRKFMSLPRWFV